MSYNRLVVRPGLELFYTGPPLEKGRLPGFFYFALSAEESLTLSPYNQPIAALASAPLRCFSLTLPAHHLGYKAKEAMYHWAEDAMQGAPLLCNFFEDVEEAILFLIRGGWLDEERIGMGGLSRGGWIATQIAARTQKAKAVVGYAPLTQFSHLEEVEEEITASLNLDSQVNLLTRTAVRFYIGNRDTRVGTSHCFRFIQLLAEASYASGNRSPMAELVITPSIGHKGHGTPVESFNGGAQWMRMQLLGEKA